MFCVEFHRRRYTKEQGRDIHHHTHCCMLLCRPGEICVHGNRMPLLEERGPSPPVRPATYSSSATSSSVFEPSLLQFNGIL